MEYPIPAELAKGKTQFVVRLTASSSTMCPGIYYVRLLKDYNDHAYKFQASDWTTGDPARVSANNFTYDPVKNIIHVNAGTGANNVALMLKYQECDYTIDKSLKFMVVRGANLKTTSGASYLWWLNGSNHGTQVAPATIKTITVGDEEQQVIAWNMSTSGLYENFSGDRPNVCMGQTIFGLTSTTGLSHIYDINFVSNVDEYIGTATAIYDLPFFDFRFDSSDKSVNSKSVNSKCYDLQGRQIVNSKSVNSKLHRGIFIQGKSKKVKR